MQPQDYRQAIGAALSRIREHVRTTPVVELEPGAFGIDGRLLLKLEQLQHSGTFKARGAFNNLLARRVGTAGVIAASGGNHGAAVAFAARALGVPAEIFVPEIASPVKVRRLRDYGARVAVTGATYAEALEASRARAEATGALVVHAYDMPETICGQGTLAAELEAQAGPLDSVLVAVGGGGLVGGIAGWYRTRCRVIGVEPEMAPTMHAGLAAGRPVDVDVGGIAADSLGARGAGENTYALAAAYLADSLLVGEEAIAEAQRRMWDELRLVVEPAAAVPLAALISGAYRPAADERVGLVVCGANTDPGKLAEAV